MTRFWEIKSLLDTYKNKKQKIYKDSLRIEGNIMGVIMSHRSGCRHIDPRNRQQVRQGGWTFVVGFWVNFYWRQPSLYFYQQDLHRAAFRSLFRSDSQSKVNLKSIIFII